MILTVFRSRLDPAHETEYEQWGDRIEALGRAMPGFVSIRGYQADDGERISIVEFTDLESQRAWAAHPEHRQAMELGRTRFYTEYRIQVCEVLRESAGTGPR